jgi:hypothetical protein
MADVVGDVDAGGVENDPLRIDDAGCHRARDPTTEGHAHQLLGS